MKHRVSRQAVWTIFFSLVRYFVRPFIGYRYQREKRIQGPAIIMGNHNLDIDAGLLGLSYRQSMCVVASEHVFRMGVLTLLIRLIFSPIVRMKGKTEIRTVRKILNELKSGGRVCIFPEGNRSFNGLTGEITKASASLARMAKCQLITYRIEGGYFKHPRWARKGRRGYVAGYEVGRYSAEELRQMSTEQVLHIIRRDLHEDAYTRQQEKLHRYTGKNLAENLEVALYLCPNCRQMGTLQSRGDHLLCDCGLDARYTETGLLEGSGIDPPRFTTVTNWDRWQQDMTAELVSRAGDGSIARDEGISLFRVTPCKKDELIETGTLSLSLSALACGSFTFALDEISDLAIVGPNTLVFETGSGSYFEIRSKSAYSALKYRRFFHYCKENAKGEYDAQSRAVPSSS